MEILKGFEVCDGIALGNIHYLKSIAKKEISDTKTADATAELVRFELAKTVAKTQLDRLYHKALAEVGADNAAIFEMHQLMLEDLDYCEAIADVIMQNYTAEYAVMQTGNTFAEMFSSLDDDYMKERSADVRDISSRVIDILQGTQTLKNSVDTPYILFADDLVPSQTFELDKSLVLAFVTAKGSTNSHTAILAGIMNIPAIVAVGDAITENLDGKFAIVDGFDGVVYIDPDDETMARLTQKKAQTDAKNTALQSLIGTQNITRDNKKIKLYANIGNVEDIDKVIENDAGGIGLFRSEFLYLESKDFPSEETQFAIYKKVVEKMEDKRVIVRTLDIGADKKVGYFNLPEEENTAMGYRAIRICLTQVDIFTTQLRALYRASAYGKLSIMFPMITALKEVVEIKNILENVKKDLRSEQVPFDENVPIGIMIETPAAAIISDILAKEVDFFSIGTNDLTQYSLAVDRQNQNLQSFYDPHHTAILRMIKYTADSAHANGIWVGICGELAADKTLTETFLSFGIDELSVSPKHILELRNLIQKADISKSNNIYKI